VKKSGKTRDSFMKTFGRSFNSAVAIEKQCYLDIQRDIRGLYSLSRNSYI